MFTHCLDTLKKQLGRIPKHKSVSAERDAILGENVAIQAICAEFRHSDYDYVL